MSLTENNFSLILEEIKPELDKYKDLSRTEMFTKCLNNKLRCTLEKYNAQLNDLSDYLLQKESYRVLKTLTRIQKEKDKEVIKQNLVTEGE